MKPKKEMLQEEQHLKEWYNEICRELEDLLYNPMNIESGYKLFTREQYNEQYYFWTKELLGIDYHCLGIL